ncbi:MULTISPECIES: type I DNA topoisomerase [unclassified Mucilaginibacter]|uniref:type I DNA topoisomerase n=1 Tax=unclassified Mucilaginibacter TaxID=2617802 RepID=UPI000961A6DE|nr:MULTISPECIES: type I DNA topoisomerase [unclassified Mucilaginibacter]OJW18066.1 MAG: DNA topoisomerase I [Mucilaginibacter sp. 44-25]PLW90702.1 MAG: type I DNA topoisomerase [Mucilaginibacter sp.]PMP65563.1 MAG: type I DNA topoisomerase [Mucilaginibacter sp.]HEK19508.1 type I DNA topoisomerase [Bacteroidota bacterium]
MAKNLLIVESPAKAKTIEGYLGKDFTVKSSYGHIRDLVKSEDAIDINNNFQQKYEVPADKKQIVSELKKLAKEADMVWLASDEDREGEAISWHLYETLGLKEPATRRIVFHEITKPAIMRAIENPRKIDYNLVNAQQARRVLDRLVGFELSPVLWKKVKPSLSAGRVQSVAVRLIVEREREINKFKSEAAYKIVAIFDKGRNAFKAELPERFAKQEDAEKFLQDCANAAFNVNSLDTRPTKRSPAAPFTTSTLQQEASRKLGFSVARTMQVAQRLYESGYITYMRTDSVNLSDTALNAAEKEITSAYGDKYHQLRKYKTKNASAQEAHEAIRPTYFNNHTIDGESSEKRLYELIWKRAIASQMSEAQFEKTVARIGISTRKEELVANGEVMKFDGFLKVYLESNDDDDDNQNAEGDNAILPPLAKGQSLELQELSATERFSRPPARYTEASLVKKLEELGIGRPSTYAPTISTIQNRGYVVKEEREGRQREFKVLTLKNGTINKETKTENTGAEKGKLFPTDIGAVVNDFLVQHFNGIVDFNFTASVEKQFDEIAQGLKDWTKMIRTFYDPFHKDVESTIKTADKATGERELGVHPENGKKVSVRIGRFGPFVQVGENATDEKDEKPLYASLRTGQSIETITLEDALELFKLPKAVGEYEGKVMKVAIGRFGPYISHNGAFVSLPKEIDPLDVTEEQAIQLIEDKRKKDAEKLIKSFDEDPDVKVLNGRWGPYIEFGKLNVKIPKDKDPKSLTYAECKALADATPATPKKGRFGKAAPAKTASKAPAKKKK